ncbi:hypothetical protein MCAP1_000999 [Malassezia caprae]|uniref:Uncharacterized protein n=1 Tax=Malassezia caprae TaxID=1381934 RepID=A0AAF0IVS1_9BASI|nr:hypothetical protein MCAP1_000999 [Malassezia caprae]
MSSAVAWTQPWHAEWQLLRGALPAEDEKESLPYRVASGELESVLRSADARRFLQPVAQCMQAVCQRVPAAERAQVVVPLDQVSLPVKGHEWEALCVAIAALHAFVQLNWTGPDLPLSPMALLRSAAPDYFEARSVDDDDNAWDAVVHASSLEYLTLRGEPAYHLCEAPFYLVVSLLLLEALHQAHAEDTFPTLAMWRLRARAVHMRILDEPVACEEELLARVDALVEALVAHARTATDTRVQYLWDNIRARAMLETALMYQRTGQDRLASERLVQAAKANGLEYELSGALGKRTKWQKEAKTQLVLLAESREAGADKAEDNDTPAPSAALAALAQPENSGWQATVDPEKQVDHQPLTYSLNDDTLLEQTEFTSTQASDSPAGHLSHLDPGHQPPLAVTDQCTLLALCLNIHNTQASHGLTSEQMSAFVERVMAHPQNWSVHTMSLLLRSRLESTRTRTIERSTLQLQALVDQMPTNDSSVRERLRFFHTLELPAKWAMQAELARRFLSMGVLRSALEVFERVEMWEEVVQCLGLLGRQTEGKEVVRDLLAGHKTEAQARLQEKRIATSASRVPRTHFVRGRLAKLWCLLGDMEPANAEAHYLHAWDVSGGTSSRAARSLGGYHFALHAYAQSSAWLRRAVRINALYPRTWFMLGCSYMRLERWLEAAASFRQCTALEEEDGESWNNLASCYLRMQDAQVPRLDTVLDEDEEADGASTAASDSGVSLGTEEAPGAPASGAGFELRLLAHKALGIALKFQFESWRVWTNYMIVSVDVGLLSEAARALTRIVEIRTRESSQSARETQAAASIVDMAVLNKLVDAVIRAPAAEAEDASAPVSAVRRANEGEGLRPVVERLFVDTLLPRFSSEPALWQAYARLLFAQNEFRAMLTARIQSFQCGLGSPEALDVVTDRPTWIRAKDELQELCDLLENLATRPASPDSSEEALPDWRFRARTLVRTFMARTRDSFDTDPAWDELTELAAALQRGRS